MLFIFGFADLHHFLDDLLNCLNLSILITLALLYNIIIVYKKYRQDIFKELFNFVRNS